ncbi:MAG TPA: FtsX-like permease family protein [Caldilineaceae bacterium]|nr:FtsX-like permease family protein [Caldilineaceae bacterium]
MSESIETISRERVLPATRVFGVARVSYQLISLKMAWRNMWRNWRRTAIALIAIVLGLILLLFMEGLIKGSDQAIFGNAVRLYGGNIQVHAPGFRDKAMRLPLLPLENADAIVEAARAQPQVLLAAKRINTGGMISSREGAYRVAITAIEPAIEGPHSIQAENIVAGRYLLPEDGDAVLIGKGLADLLDVTVGDRVTLVGRGAHEMMRQRTMTVVGIYDLGMAEAEKGTVFITLPEAQSLYDLRDQVTEVTILLKEMGQESAVLAPLRAAFPNAEVDAWDTLRPEIRQMMDTKATVVAFVSFIVLLVASIGVLNLMLMAVFERTREMGILAALGMKGRQIMGLFLLEGTLIGVVGAVIGCAIGVVILSIFSQVGISFSSISGMGEATALMGDRIYTAYTPGGVVGRGATVALITALASLYPAWQAARQEPAQALHHV